MRIADLIARRTAASVWTSTAPVREEFFGVDRLEQHARSLANAQAITRRPVRVLSLRTRLKQNADSLLVTYRAIAADAAAGRSAPPAAEWLLDNFPLVEEQVRQVREHLSPGFYHQLPKLESGPFAGYPRVFGAAWAFVAHTDSHFDPEVLRRFIDAYQSVEVLTIGELWAFAITLRIVLVENLRRIADELVVARRDIDEADRVSDRLLATHDLDADAPTGPFSDAFAAQLAKRLRDQDPTTSPAPGWLERRLRRQATTVEEVVVRAQQRQAGANVTIRNIITSLRRAASTSWPDLVESVSRVDAALRARSDFDAMDFATRNLYRNAIEELARGSGHAEVEIANRALRTAAIARAAAAGDPVEADRVGDPGYHLISLGRDAFEASIVFVPPLAERLSRFNIRLGIDGYVAATMALTAALLAVTLRAVFPGANGEAGGLWFAAFAVLAFLPLSDTANAIVTRALTASLRPMLLPAMELEDGPDVDARTLVAMPTLLTHRAEIDEQVERLEVHFLSGAPGEFYFALVTDWADAADERTADDDALLAVAADAIAQLNARHPAGVAGPRFRLLHRRRRFNASEGVWMGWERKRGKLHELNQLLRGATDTSFVAIDGDEPQAPDGVRYVITLDADTRLPRDVARRLVGKMRHPLNRPTFDVRTRRVVRGYGILQPRVTPALPVGVDQTPYQRAYSGPGGIDPYASALSDIYQDLFGEGSYTGKGIYDVDAFEASLAGRVPDNRMLSHDLFEGAFARAGLATDVEVVEDFPARFDVAVKRMHRWVRGDWQLLGWIAGHWRGADALSAESRWKMIDNLRRSLVAPAAVLAIVVAWALPMPHAWTAQAVIVVALVFPSLLSLLAAVPPRSRRVSPRGHLDTLGRDLRTTALQIAIDIATLSDRAWRSTDAIVRSLYRMTISHRRLLEWTTAAHAGRSAVPDLTGFYRSMAASVALAFVAAFVALVAGASPAAVLPLAIVWLAGPAVAWHVSRQPRPASATSLSIDDARELRLIARRTWRFFETFVTAAENDLPPDNFQEDPQPIVAPRTSPTNIGLYLLATVAARDFGWIATGRALRRFEATFDTLDRLPTFNGHFFNWYATRDLRPLDPRYVSSVDSGNLAGHLIALANACDDWRTTRIEPTIRQGLSDALALAREESDGADHALQPLARLLADDAAIPGLLDDLAAALPAAVAACGPTTEAGAWLATLSATIAQHRDDAAEAATFDARLAALAARGRRFALAMDFRFLVDPERELLSIGYSLADHRLDNSCYDLLASEARLASLFAIAKGDAPSRHWFRLGRAAVPVRHRSALISWSGSMFEYLMPSLVMRAPDDSLIADSNRMAVARQQDYAAARGIPWGISEAAFNARDVELTYQYSNFGVPGLGLKRGLADDLVVAPYATGLAAMVDARGALANYRALAAIGALGLYGFYESIDYTRTRVPQDAAFVVVRNYMAHHQGMTIVSIANTLTRGRIREHFHREPMIVATELLLQERVPRDVTAVPLPVESARTGRDAIDATSTVRRIEGEPIGPPITHLLSNGRYGVMLTAAGGGYSRWGDVAITRWREDPTRDADGSFVYVHDCRSHRTWSIAPNPLVAPARNRTLALAEHHVAFERRDGRLTTTLEVLVSGEDDAEVRRVTIDNRSRHLRELELTSYAELVLTSVQTDQAHPAFAKMFVETEYDAASGALIATRRPRSADETPVWVAHFTVVEGETVGEPQYESDRMAFIGRNRSLAAPAALVAGTRLSGSTGTVLDPVFSVRRRVRVHPGEVVRVAWWTMVAPTRQALDDMIDSHRQPSAFDRAMTFAWTRAQVQLRHLGITSEEAAGFQQLAAPLLYADARYRGPSRMIERGSGPQSNLWQHAISGDLPIVLLRIDDVADLEQVRQLLRGWEYWRAKRLAVDLVIVNERASSYVQDLQQSIEAAVRGSQSRLPLSGEPARGAVFTLRSDLMSAESRALLRSVARVSLVASRGPLAQQLIPFAAVETRTPNGPSRPRPPAPLPATTNLLRERLAYYNGIGGFSEDGRQYVTILDGDRNTPAPWIDVVANQRFGFHASTVGSGFTWAENSRENPVTPWSNDAVRDPTFEAIYVRDDALGVTMTATAEPIRDDGVYVARHGFGQVRFEHEAHGLALDLVQLVPLDDPLKISRLTIRNRSNRTRRLTITGYVEWALAPARAAQAFLETSIDPVSRAMLARNPWTTAFAGRVSFFDLAGRQRTWTGDRTEFVGRLGTLAAPAALAPGVSLTNTTGAGLDPCGALQYTIELPPDGQATVVAFLGQCANVDQVHALIERYRKVDVDEVLAQVDDHWSTLLGTVQVKTPDRSLNLMLNGWLLYQVTACRLWARSAFYQASGAYGFRDQLQDGMALTFARPDWTRHHLLRAASRQFVEGDVQHWWLPHSGQGVRTHISDDRVWLAYGVATYIEVSGDSSVLGERVPFLEGPLLSPEVHDHFDTPAVSDEVATLFEHCARGLDQCIALTGANGLPLMGTGDWNDGMNRVGQEGRGESVWLGWLFVRTIELFAPHADRYDADRAARWRTHADSVREAIERTAWDGEWYRRATFDDGTWLGSKDSDECRIDSIAQSWAVLSGAADHARARTAMASVEKHLIRDDPGMALLFTPPFDHTSHDPGYIKGYPPGLRENGGQYSHAAMWLIFAYAKLGDPDRALALFNRLNPVEHATTPADAQRYRTEPYVVAADVYSVAPHVGRGGWTWYTGSAAWMYRAGIEGLLGLSREGRTLVLAPKLPAAWPGFEIAVTLGEARWVFVVTRGDEPSATVDDVVVPYDGTLRVSIADGDHRVTVTTAG